MVYSYKDIDQASILALLESYYDRRRRAVALSYVAPLKRQILDIESEDPQLIHHQISIMLDDPERKSELKAAILQNSALIAELDQQVSDEPERFAVLDPSEDLGELLSADRYKGSGLNDDRGYGYGSHSVPEIELLMYAYTDRYVEHRERIYDYQGADRAEVEADLVYLERAILAVETDDPLVVYQQLRILLIPTINPWDTKPSLVRTLLENAWSLACIDAFPDGNMQPRLSVGIRSPDPMWPVNLCKPDFC